MRRYLLGEVILLASVACNRAGDDPPGAPAGGERDASPADTPPGNQNGQDAEAGVVCNDLALDAPAVGFTYHAADAPAPTGGAIADGTYWLTAQLVYRTPSGSTIPLGRTKLVITGATWQEVSGDPLPGSINPDKRRTYALAATGTSLALTRTCPSTAEPEIATYTAEATRITLYVEDRGKTVGTVFTKQ